MTTLTEALRKLQANYADRESRGSMRSEMVWLDYFAEARSFATGRELEALLDGVLAHSEIVTVERGKMLYRMDEKADAGYFLLSGQLELYSRKSQWQRTEFIKYGRRLGQPSFAKEVSELTGFEEEQLPKKLTQAFSDQKIEQFVKYNHFHSVRPGEYLGFAELPKLLTRPFTAMATVNSTLIVVGKSDFDEYLLEYEREKQIKMIEMLCVNMEPTIYSEVKNMFHYLGPYILIKKCTNQQILEREGDKVSGCYLITRGEFETYKDVEMMLPDEYAKREIKSIKSKSVSVTVARLLPGQLIGEEELVVNQHFRLYTLKSISGQSEVLKIDSGEFIKLLNERYDVLKFLSRRAKEKVRLNQQKFKQASDRLIDGFYKQYRDYQEKKQDKLVQQVVGQNKISSEEIECLKEEEPGIFYRDTFEKIEKMALFAGTNVSDNYKELIKRRKNKVIKGGTFERQESPRKLELDISTQQKLLFSSRKVMNRAELMANYLRDSREDKSSLQKVKLHKRTKSNSPPKREEFKEDKLRVNEEVHRRVLIKKGIYKKQIAPFYQPFKVSTNFHEHFDSVIESCITRKNQGIKRIESPLRKKDLIDTAYKTIIKKTKTRQDDSSLEPVRMFHSWTIKDLRKTFSTFSRTQRPPEQESISPTKTARSGFQQGGHKEIMMRFDCILAPSKLRKEVRLSQQDALLNMAEFQSTREYFSSSSRLRPEAARPGPKLVLLNHMMKPISYNN